MREPKAPPRAALTLLFALIVFVVLSITMAIIGVAAFVLVRLEVLPEIIRPSSPVPIGIFAVVSIVTGTIVATIFSKIPLQPVNKLISGLNRLAAGDYDTRIRLGANPVGRDLTESFNLLAEELKNTEMLRSDFVNNFSHEFKTPIVSIRGFAKLLQRGHVPEDKAQEYLAIIVEESTRLSELATNVLNMTKVENQSILTEVTTFNLSEQMRDCILLLEKKWTRKRLTIAADFDEQSIRANEELLMQVWINLLDNSIKFSREGGEVGVAIAREDDRLAVRIRNNGPQISAEDQKRMFNKFWQGDTSHAAEGTGIGLSVAQRIVRLHDGEIGVESTPEETVFTVVLPA